MGDLRYIRHKARPAASASRRVRKIAQLTQAEKESMVGQHEGGDSIYVLADEYGISPRSVAAYVANAHR
jgi:DNA-binding CsgD family transcriptional regulator